jgi:hypothetical protein
MAAGQRLGRMPEQRGLVAGVTTAAGGTGGRLTNGE